MEQPVTNWPTSAASQIRNPRHSESEFILLTSHPRNCD